MTAEGDCVGSPLLFILNIEVYRFFKKILIKKKIEHIHLIYSLIRLKFTIGSDLFWMSLDPN